MATGSAPVKEADVHRVRLIAMLGGLALVAVCYSTTSLPFMPLS